MNMNAIYDFSRSRYPRLKMSDPTFSSDIFFVNPTFTKTMSLSRGLLGEGDAAPPGQCGFLFFRIDISPLRAPQERDRIAASFVVPKFMMFSHLFLNIFHRL